MRLIMLSFCLCCIHFICEAQNQKSIPTPIEWDITFEESENSKGQIVFKASIDEGWVLYSQDNSGEGPVPTYFEIESSEDYDLIGQVTEHSELISEFSELFYTEVNKYKKEAIFKQEIAIKNPSSLNGFVEFMTCDGERCLPPKEVPFQIDIK